VAPSGAARLALSYVSVFCSVIIILVLVLVFVLVLAIVLVLVFFLVRTVGLCACCYSRARCCVFLAGDCKAVKVNQFGFF
jgi:hypothetical protein